MKAENMIGNDDKIQSVQDLLTCVKQPDVISMDCSLFNRGIDNYHVDVHLSDSFVLQASLIIESVVKRVIAGDRAIPGNSDELENFRNAFNDMMRTTFHRAKTDLQVEAIRFLQFGVVKFILLQTRVQLDTYTKQLEESIAQQQYAGSRSLLPSQEKLAWYRKNYNDFLYRANRAVFQQLQREENGHLRGLRTQLLGSEFPELVNILYNPMLTADSPTDILLLVENYGLWTDFNETNAELETMLQAHLKELPTLPLKPVKQRSSAQSEVFDELSGLFSVQSLLGPSDDQSNEVSESFTWLEQPGNVRLLFDGAVHDAYLQKAKETQGMIDHRSFKSALKELLKLISEIREKLFPEKLMKEALAAYLLREKWIRADRETFPLETACAYIAGNDIKRILSKLDLEKESTAALLKKLDEIAVDVNRLYREELYEKFLRLLSDFCRYRLHLKYFRFAHRIFNRVKLILNLKNFNSRGREASFTNCYDLMNPRNWK
ncbi:MAG: hypothetical protein JKY88_01520 [Pseudomonadales bacterium]|nr:hypothetical protein [Pseudomonadales bacterium]